MSRTSLLAVAVLAAVPALSACGAGMHPQTALPTQLTEGVNVSIGKVDVRNLFVLGPLPGQRLTAHSDAPVYTAIVNTGPTPDRLLAVDAPGLAGATQIAGRAIALPPATLVTTNRPVAGTPAPQPRPSAINGPRNPSSGSPSPTRSSAPGGPPSPKKSSTPSGPPRPTRSSTLSATPLPSRSASSAPAVTEPSTLILKNLVRDLSGGETVRLVFHFQRAGTLTADVPVEPMQGYYTTYSPAPAPFPASQQATTAR